MSVIFLLLKIIGIVLLCLLGLVLLAIVLVLFVPITYRIKGSFHEKKLTLHIRVFWLCYLLGFCMDVTQEEQNSYLRILGIKKSFGKHDNPQEIEDTIPNSENAVPPEEKPEEEHVLSSEERQPSRKTPNSEPQQAPKVSFITKCKDFFNNLKFRITHFVDTLKSIMALLTDEVNQAACKKIGSKVFILLKKLLPGRLKLNLKYSTGSPDTTGQLLGVLAMFPIAYRNRWIVFPDFMADDFYVEADFDARGHVFGIQILSTVLGIVLDKNCQRLYNKIRR